MPRPIFSSGERTQWATGVYNNRHTELQMRTDLTRVIKSGSREQMEEARGQLCPFLRDTLVGLNYAYYEPPGAQILHNNPLFVRSHDFSGDTVAGVEHVWQASQLFGEGFTGGRWRAFSRLARRLAIRASAGGAGFHRPGKRSGSDLEGVGSRTPDQCDLAALVECEPE